MDLQRPTYIDPIKRGPGASLFGAGPGENCPSWITYLIVGAIAMYAIPPFLSGMIEGGSQAWRERKD